MNIPSRKDSRRRFLQTAGAAAAAMIWLPGRAPGAGKPRLRFAVIGIQHEHIFRMVQAVREGGGELAMIFDPDPDPTHGAKFLKDNPDVKRAREEREVLEAKDIALVVTDALPAQRAQVGIRAMRAGKDVLADKGGFLNLEDLAEARRVQAETKRIYSISYNERLLLPVSGKIDELIKAGAIGRVTRMTGTGPHGLFGHGPRPAWFWTKAGRGGILADVGAHQADQFLHYVGGEEPRIVSAQVGNFENPDHPEFEDWGRVIFKSKAGDGESTVSFYTGKSGGFRLELEGTEGRMEVRTQSGQITLFDRAGKTKEYRVDPRQPCPFGRQLVADVLNRTQTAMPQAHAFLASELAVKAQLAAVRIKQKPA